MMELDSRYYVDGVRAGSRKALAKTITLIESARPDHQSLAARVLDELLPFSGNALRLGITGVPGVGKSTFIESLGMHLVEKGHRLAILAVDPSSVSSHGSILGDKTRMEKLAAHPGAFIRPSPAGGTLGGVTRKTRESLLACEAAGFDIVMVETVGVGQSEVSVAAMVDFFLLLTLAGAGDELQGIKRGILELVDAIVVNKADGDNREKAVQTAKMYADAMHLFSRTSPDWEPAVLTCSALEMKGIRELWETVRSHHEKLKVSGGLEAKRKKQALDWMGALLDEGLKDWFYHRPEIKKLLPEMIRAVAKGEVAPPAAVKNLLNFLTF